MNCQWFLSHHCRSCELLDQSYENTLRSKEEKLKSLFPRVDLHEMKTIGLEHPAAESRNKAKLAVFTDTEGLIRFGFYDSAGSPRVLEECPLHMKELNNLLPVLKEKLAQYKIIPYSLNDKKGELKYVILSKSASHGEILLRFIVRSKESLDRLRIMTKILQEEIPLIKVATVNIQPEHKAVLEGDEEIVITPESVIENKFGDIHLNLGPRSFFQVTPEIAGKLYQTAADLIEDYKIKSFLDLFCGVGAFSYFAAKHCPKVLGIEISKEAIDCALSSKGLNKIQGELDFKALDVEEFLKSAKGVFEGILVNPPRRGLNNSIIESILSQKPKFIIYSSCNSETLARDYEELKRDYKITRTQIFDMFPFTTHFETLMVFSRKDF